MACGSGCCVPAVKQPTALGLYPSSSSSAHAERGHLGKHVPEHMATLGVHGDTHACTDGCCEVTDASAGGKVTAAATLEDNSGDSCCAAEVTSRTDSNEAADGCQDKCCTAEAVSQGQGTTDYGCCGDDICCQKDQDFNAQNQKAQEQVVCNDKSCDEKGPVFSSKPEECCLGKPSPCCDDSCLDRLAARECRNFSTRCSGESPWNTFSSRIVLSSPSIRYVVILKCVSRPQPIYPVQVCRQAGDPWVFVPCPHRTGAGIVLSTREENVSGAETLHVTAIVSSAQVRGCMLCEQQCGGWITVDYPGSIKI